MQLLKKTRKTLSQATNFEGIKRQQSFLIRLFRFIFKVEKTKNPCEFEELKNKGIDERQINAALSRFCVLYRFFFVLATLILLYFFFLLVKKYYMGALLSISVSFMFFALSFKYHFWVFQIKRKKLGNSFLDWTKYVLQRDR